MAESDWDTVTVLRKKGPTAAQAKSKQVSMITLLRRWLLVCSEAYPQQKRHKRHNLNKINQN